MNESEKWLFAMQLRLAGVASQERANRIAASINADYPNQFFKLTNNGRVVGWRRVFGDRSYCEGYEGEPLKIHHGTMTDGMLGEAQNGRVIMKIH